MSAWSPITIEDFHSDGSLRSYGWGGVELVYLTDREHPLCSVCAARYLKQQDFDEHGQPCMVGPHESGEPICCEECSHTIKSTYGP